MATSLERFGAFRRDGISAALCNTGITRTLEALARAPSLVVLNYHRIGDPESDSYDPALLESTPDAFDAQLSFLKKRYQVCEVAEALELIAQPSAIRAPCVLITFDDGYRDNYEVALPILRAHGVKAVFFLATGYVGTARIPWWDQIAYMCRLADRRTITLDYPESRSFDLDVLPLQRVIREIIRLYKSPHMLDPARFVAQLESACGVDCPVVATEPLFMSWEQVRGLVSSGMGVGSHTHSHEILTKQTEAEQYAECTVSRDILKAQLGIDVSMLSYPVGGSTTYDDVTRECVRRAGYRAAFTYGGGVNVPRTLKPFAVTRMAVEPCSLEYYRTRVAVAALTRRTLW